MAATPLPVSSSDEWSPLKSVIIGRAKNSMFPHEHKRMIAATTSAKYVDEFRRGNPFPEHITEAADRELDQFASILEGRGIRVYRPAEVDWAAVGGYTGSMVRDGLLVVGSTIIESAYSWRCREHEVDLMLEQLLFELARDERVNVVRAPKPPARETLYDGFPDANGINPLNGVRWAINNSRIAFDAADFIRFGKHVVGQLSHVTNDKGIEYVRKHLPEGYSLDVIELDDPHSMHLVSSPTFPPTQKKNVFVHFTLLHHPSHRPRATGDLGRKKTR
ncbi:hypothetical protein MPH_12516 [Macrophomina phaseolina MS6]|uniref:Glycine amidinotransferase, mitochondrial n=1 Tax=Macrophomina phaseolina (strain MS6) TaxID=1126212 RepID=K2RBY5_MACPH|nr:hypothetical protein MPH_12516 [Macrophomina phaseolina MS6]